MFIVESILLIMKTSVSFYTGYIHRKTTNFFNGEYVTCIFDYDEHDHIWSFLLNLDNKQQAFTNCVHGYNHARNVHANSITRARKFVQVLICFYRSQFCNRAINEISLSQSKGWFPFILLRIWEKYH